MFHLPFKMNMVHRNTWYQKKREKEKEIRKPEADGLWGYTAQDHSIWGPANERKIFRYSQ